MATLERNKLSTSLSFLYFLTLHADLLSIRLGMMSFRLNNLIALILSLCIASHFWKRKFTISRSFLTGIAIITFSFILSFLFSAYKIRCFFFLGWWGITLIFYLLLPYILLQILGYKKFFSLYLLSFLVVGCYAFIQLMLSCVGIHDPFASQFVLPERIVRANAFCYEPSYYALYMTPFVMMGNLFYILKARNSFPLVPHLSFWHLIVINFLFFLSTSTSTLFSYFFLFAVLLCVTICLKQFFVHFVTFFIWIGGGLSLFFISFPFLAKEFFLKFFYHGFQTHHSFLERWVGIINGFALFKQHPFIGVGGGAYPFALLDRYAEGDQRFSFLHNTVTENLSKTIKNFEPSNALIEIISSLGMIGMIAFGIFIFLFFLRFHAVWKSNNCEDKKKESLIFFIATIVMIVTLQFNQGLFRTYIWTQIAFSWGYFDTTLAFHANPFLRSEVQNEA